VTTWGELEEVEALNGGNLDTREVPESLASTSLDGILSEDNQWATALHMATVAHLTLTGTDGVGVLALHDVIEGTDSLEGLLGLGSLAAVEGIDNKGHLWDVIDLVATGHHEGWES